MPISFCKQYISLLCIPRFMFDWHTCNPLSLIQTLHAIYLSIRRPQGSCEQSYLVDNAQWPDGCPPGGWHCHRCVWSVQHGTCRHLLWQQAHQWWCHLSPHWRWHQFSLDPAGRINKERMWQIKQMTKVVQFKYLTSHSLKTFRDFLSTSGLSSQNACLKSISLVTWTVCLVLSLGAASSGFLMSITFDRILLLLVWPTNLSPCQLPPAPANLPQRSNLRLKPAFGWH